MKKILPIIIACLSCSHWTMAADKKTKEDFVFTLSAGNMAASEYNVSLNCSLLKDSVDFVMPSWTTGYYQLMDYWKNVHAFTAKTSNQDTLPWKKISNDTWRVYSRKKPFTLQYAFTANRLFVASSFISDKKGFVSPAGAFMYAKGYINAPSVIKIELPSQWKDIATGLERLTPGVNAFFAKNFDILYDSPILMGNLDSLPSFTVKGIPHYFVGADMGDFDHASFIKDVQKIVTACSDIIGDIPYKHYTFIAIGPGGGGIEHLNSTSISFSGKGLETKAGRDRMYSFLAHEYFHHYNVKRIRPIELGPFDYTQPNRTKQLWISEGLTVYYEYIALNKAGLMNTADVLATLQGQIIDFEKTPGKAFQSLSEASWHTWSDGPFGRKDDEVNKTISYYNKGPIVGTMLDFAIRNATNNDKSLNDVMRYLYQTYYQQKQRGFNEAEFKAACQQIAGKPMDDFFEYIYSTTPLNYEKYFGYAGLQVDTVAYKQAGSWLGVQVRQNKDSVMVSNVEWQSPAWDAGLRRGDIITAVGDSLASAKSIEDIAAQHQPSDKVMLTVVKKSTQTTVPVTLGILTKKKFSITPINQPSALQSTIFKSWLQP